MKCKEYLRVGTRTFCGRIGSHWVTVRDSPVDSVLIGFPQDLLKLVELKYCEGNSQRLNLKNFGGSEHGSDRVLGPVEESRAQDPPASVFSTCVLSSSFATAEVSAEEGRKNSVRVVVCKVDGVKAVEDVVVLSLWSSLNFDERESSVGFSTVWVLVVSICDVRKVCWPFSVFDLDSIEEDILQHLPTVLIGNCSKIPGMFTSFFTIFLLDLDHGDCGFEFFGVKYVLNCLWFKETMCEEALKGLSNISQVDAM